MIIHTDFAHLYYYKFFRDLFIPQNIYKVLSTRTRNIQTHAFGILLFSRDVFDLAEFFEACQHLFFGLLL